MHLNLKYQKAIYCCLAVVCKIQLSFLVQSELNVVVYFWLEKVCVSAHILLPSTAYFFVHFYATYTNNINLRMNATSSMLMAFALEKK